MVAFVESGKGLIALHAASAMFTNSEKYLAMVGAQFPQIPHALRHTVP
jgi:type 1 glutamine amidotransferase